VVKFSNMLGGGNKATAFRLSSFSRSTVVVGTEDE